MINLEKLCEEQNLIEQKFNERVREDNFYIRSLADNMAEAATNIQGQGYAAFVAAREQFLREMDRLCDEYSNYLYPSGRKFNQIPST